MERDRRHSQSQLQELRSYAERNGWRVYEYREAASSRLDDPCPLAEFGLRVESALASLTVTHPDGVVISFVKAK